MENVGSAKKFGNRHFSSMPNYDSAAIPDSKSGLDLVVVSEQIANRMCLKRAAISISIYSSVSRPKSCRGGIICERRKVCHVAPYSEVDRQRPKAIGVELERMVMIEGLLVEIVSVAVQHLLNPLYPVVKDKFQFRALN
jgi:hypothetical protein